MCLESVRTHTAGASFLLTRYFSRGSVSNASPNIDRQYSAILACCFGLRVSESQHERQRRKLDQGVCVGVCVRLSHSNVFIENFKKRQIHLCSLNNRNGSTWSMQLDIYVVEFAAMIWNDSRVHVVLKGEDDGERGGLEGTLGYGLDHLLKGINRLSYSCKYSRKHKKKTINVTTGFCNNLLWPPGKYCILHTLISQQESFQFTI